MWRLEFKGLDEYRQPILSRLERLDDTPASIRTCARGEAKRLAAHFKAQKERIQAPLRGVDGKLPAGAYAPLNFGVRGTESSTLELFWFTVKFVNGHKITDYIKRGKSRGYSVYKLRELAHEYELDLVLETEAVARDLRCLWQYAGDIERANRGLIREVLKGKTAPRSHETSDAMARAREELQKLVDLGHLEGFSDEDALAHSRQMQAETKGKR